MPPAGKERKKKRKRKYTKQRVMPITEGSDSLTQVSHTTYWRMREKVERERETAFATSTVHNHLFSLTSLKLVSPATPPNKIP